MSLVWDGEERVAPQLGVGHLGISMNLRNLKTKIGLLISIILVSCFSNAISDEVSKTMDHKNLETKVKQHLSSAYPNIIVEVKPWEEDKSKLAVYFTEEKFSFLYPMQRYHYLVHSLPDEFFRKYLSDSVWFELAPGEKPEQLRYPDKKIIQDITPDVLRVLKKAKFFESLDDLMAPKDASQKALECHGDFRITKLVLQQKGFKEDAKIDELFDICHVLMSQGAFCDCEVLYNVSENNRLKSRYWKNRAKNKGDAQH